MGKCMQIIRILILVSLSLLAIPLLAADAKIITDQMVGNWEVQCSKEACLVILYRSPGVPVDNTTVVKVDKATMKPENFGIMISGDINENNGFVAQFVKTEVDMANPKCAGGPDTPRPADCYQMKRLPDKVFNGPFDDCKSNGLCFANIPGQYIGDEKTPGRIDLLDEYENDDSLLVLWNDKKGNLKSVMLDIYGFRKAYDTALSVLRK
jgi:hypothetical protein